MNWTVLYSMIKKLTSKVDNLESLSPFSYKGEVATRSDLPAKATKGAMYTIADEDNLEVAWSGSKWVDIGPDIKQTKADVEELKSLGFVKKNGVLYCRHRKEN